MYCSASATLWTKSSCLRAVTAGGSGGEAGILAGTPHRWPGDRPRGVGRENVVIWLPSADAPGGGLMRIVLLLLLLAWSGHASAETVATCKGHIDALPAVIDTPGIWCVDHDLATSVASGAAISVTAHNVTIDCNGFRLGGLPAGPNTLAAGIRADDVLNLTVRNCAIRGFAIGIWTAGGGGHLVTRNRIDGSTLGGIIVGTGRTDGTGVSDGSAVRDNQIWNTGGRFTAAIGIHTWGTVDIVGNTVSNVTALAGTSGTPEATGIDINDNPGTLVERNIVDRKSVV